MGEIPELPERLSCEECGTDQERLIHWAVSSEVHNEGDEPSGPWSWEILNHDKTSKFKWPKEFDTKDRAWSHIRSILKEAMGDDVV
jgi:hypothetical protein